LAACENVGAAVNKRDLRGPDQLRHLRAQPVVGDLGLPDVLVVLLALDLLRLLLLGLIARELGLQKADLVSALFSRTDA
jgi:hypothetical protein